ncbi:MAG: [FeFe] hydrogenase H-cluster radical SAM maturase HydG [Endomicrobiales bacterium]|nr:[FeFe] hydrogenase H-cluster radical SAM maturase HydG [Endomicrobiales bacterium]
MNEKSWIESQIIPNEIEKYLNNGKDFINESEILAYLSNASPEKGTVRAIIAKALAIETLLPQETAMLLNVQDPDLLLEMQDAALKIKLKVYDNRIVTFAPLYLNDYCVNNCSYCGLRKDNISLQRKALSATEIISEVETLAGKIGHKRLVLVYGEHPTADVDYITESMRLVYGVKVKAGKGYGQIRRVNINAAPMSVEKLKKLVNADIGTYQVFQETYHKESYAKLHPAKTLKANYLWRLYTMHRAFEAGVDDVGIGALFGLYNWKFEVMGLLYHTIELEKKFGVGPHTISFPRLEPALNTNFEGRGNYKVSDEEFKKLITVLRLSIPYAGMILTARESEKLRRETLMLGCTQMDASSRIGVGSYSKEDFNQHQEGEGQQFVLGDTRTLDELIYELSCKGMITSFCTAGYRCKRTGKCIMDLLKNGDEGKFCKLNAILTFREWLDDFASPKTKIAGEKVIEKELMETKEKNPIAYPMLAQYYERIKNGERDLYF